MDMSLNLILVFTLFVMIMIGVLLIRTSRREKRQNRKLEEMNQNLTTKDVNKDEFLSFAAHQLRSPLTSIKWGLGSLRDNFSLETIKHLETTTDDLIGTVNDLLDISKIEQGGIVMNKEEFDMHDFVGRLVEEFRGTTESKNLTLRFVGENAVCFVKADQNKMRQVFVNLIDNAVKYTKSGEIRVVFQRNAEMAEVSVIDTGPGIDSEERKNLFDKFVRGAAGKASQGGSGLGLYLAKKIVEAHGGDIEVSSKGLGKGSTFTVTLPIKS
jgi:signal transduction histidine kinase